MKMRQKCNNPEKVRRGNPISSTQQNNKLNTSQEDDPRHVYKFHSKLQLFKIFCLIVTYRLANAWMIRTQFDPDEYWQTLEPAYCLAFGSHSKRRSGSTLIAGGVRDALFTEKDGARGCALTWEWTRRWSRQSSDVFHSSAQSDSFVGREMGDNKSIMPGVYTQQLSITRAIFHFIERAMNGPVRSYVSILPTYWYYLLCRSLFDWAEESNENITDDDPNLAWTSFWSHFIHSVRDSTRIFIHRHATYMISKGPVFLHALLVAAPTDFSVYLIASHLTNLENPTKSSVTGQSGGNLSFSWQKLKLRWSFWALVCSMTSWFHGYALIRTYANSMEAVCLTVGVVLLAPELFGEIKSTNAAEMSTRSSSHRPQAKLAFVLGGLSACIRFTSLAAWIPLGLIISIRSGRAKSSLSYESAKKLYDYNKVCGTLIKLCAAYGLLGVLIGCCVDRWGYGFWAVPFLGNFHFNIILRNGSLYGTHPFLWYIYAGIPAICGSMLPFLLFNVVAVFSNKPSRFRSKYNKIDDARLVLIGIIFPYIILHSFSEHKEFRFLLPILPIICVLAADSMVELIVFMECDVASISVDADGNSNGQVKHAENDSRERQLVMSKYLIVAIILLNYPHLLYLGLIHQRGPIAVNRYLTSVISKDVQKNGTGPSQYSIHYLMGCHSTPLFSHLHIPNVNVSAWHLDCSPDCRSSSEEICESDSFLKDPLGFVKATYGHLQDGVCVDSNNGNASCLDEDRGVNGRKLPELIVVMQHEAAAIDEILMGDWGMEHLGSIKHSISSLSRHSRQSEYCLTSLGNNKSLCHDPIAFLSLNVNFEHIEVYSLKKG